MDLIGSAEVAVILGVTRRRVNGLVRERADFPAPTSRTSRGERLWRRQAIERWAATADRTPGPKRKKETPR